MNHPNWHIIFSVIISICWMHFIVYLNFLSKQKNTPDIDDIDNMKLGNERGNGNTHKKTLWIYCKHFYLVTWALSSPVNFLSNQKSTPDIFIIWECFLNKINQRGNGNTHNKTLWIYCKHEPYQPLSIIHRRIHITNFVLNDLNPIKQETDSETDKKFQLNLRNPLVLKKTLYWEYWDQCRMTTTVPF